MEILETMVSNAPDGREDASEAGLIEKARIMLLHAAAAGDEVAADETGDDALSAAPMASSKRDPFASSPDDDDDNAYQTSDAVLSGDREEVDLDRLMKREGAAGGRAPR